MLSSLTRSSVILSTQTVTAVKYSNFYPVCYQLVTQTGILSGRRRYSVIKDFQDKIKEETDKNPELKRTLEQLSEKGQQISEKSKEAAEKLKQASTVTTQKLSEATGKVTETFSKVSSTLGEQVKKTQEAVKQTIQSTGFKFESKTADSSESQSQSQQQQPNATESFTSRFRKSFKFSFPGTNQEGSQVSKLKSVLSTIGREVADAVLPREESVSSTKVRENVWSAPQEVDPSAPSQLTVVPKKESVWQQKFNQFRERFASHPLFRSLSGMRESKLAKKTAELAEDVRERIETHDSPVVNRVLDAHDKFFSETEIQRAYRKLLKRDQTFDMVKFLSSLKVDIPVVVKGYLEANQEVLEQHCSQAMVERLMGMANSELKQGRLTDSTILEIGEVELMPEGLKLLDDEPVIIVQFNCQQIHCVRDKFGNVLEGGPDNIQRVFYLWALRQEEHGAVTNTGQVLPPRWQIVDMMVRGMQHLL